MGSNVTTYDAKEWEQYNVNFLEIPLGLGLQSLIKKIVLNLNAGINNNFLVSENSNNHLHYLHGSKADVVIQIKITKKANKYALSAYTGIAIVQGGGYSPLGL